MRFLNLVLFLILSVLLISCSYNRPMQGERGEIGAPGNDGRDGNAGNDGSNGSSCSVLQISNGAIITCTDGTSSVLLNGIDGTDGTNGTDAQPSAYSITQLIDPCGAQSSFDEVLLKTGDGSIIAHFSHGNKQFLSLIGPGNYVTTDGTNCYFSVDQNMNVTW